MNRSVKLLGAAGCAALLLGISSASAQEQNQNRGNRGNFDPAQMRQQMMDRYREQLEVKNDDEWKIIQARIEKVTEARREVGLGGGGGFGGFGRQRGGGGGGGGGAGGGAGGDTQREGGGRRGGGGFGGGQASPESAELQKAVEAKASAEELKTKLAKLRDARKEKEVKLEKAQEDLRKVLSVRQEASAVLMGLLR
jgi:hypothetical protein